MWQALNTPVSSHGDQVLQDYDWFKYTSFETSPNCKRFGFQLLIELFTWKGSPRLYVNGSVPKWENFEMMASMKSSKISSGSK